MQPNWLSMGFQSPPPQLMDLFKNMQNIESMVESAKRRDVVRAMRTWMEELHPNLVQVLVHERDQYMFEQLRRLEGKIVAVVGLGHLDGIERRWEDAQSGMSLSTQYTDKPSPSGVPSSNAGQ